MGLDMYFEAKRYLWPNWQPEKGKTQDDLIQEAVAAHLDLPSRPNEDRRVQSLVLQVGYLRDGR